MKHNFATTKTVLISLLLVLAICCLAVTVALNYSEQVAEAEGVISTEQLPDIDSSGDYPVMSIASTLTAGTAADLTSKMSSAASGDTIKLTANIILDSTTTTLTFNRANITLTLDLAGFTITGTTAANEVIHVASTTTVLNIIDSSGNDTGKITGGKRGVSITSGTFNLSGGTITGNNGSTSQDGTGVRVSSVNSSFTMKGGVISNNTTLNNGGGVFVTDGASFTMEKGTISGNTATNSGGGVFISGANSKMTMKADAQIINNIANGQGGGVYVGGGATLIMENGTISRNQAVNYGGGGLRVDTGSTFTMKDGTISRNSSGSQGGGVQVLAGSTFTMDNGTISSNTANNGGGVTLEGEGTTFTLNDGTISGNMADNGGGGVYANGTNNSFIMVKGTIKFNSSGNVGGGVTLYNSSTFEMRSGSIIQNTSTNMGGGVYMTASTIFTMKDGEISSNHCDGTNGAGGGVRLYGGGTFYFENGTISNNTVIGNGGGININGGVVEMSGGTISNNKADVFSGGVSVANGTFTMSAGTITQNSSGSTGAGLFCSNGSVVSLSGKVVIQGNYFYDNSTDNLDFTTTHTSFSVSDLQEGSYIGVRYAAYKEPFTFATNVSESLKQYFHADDETQCIGFSNNSLVLGDHNLYWVTDDASTHYQTCDNCEVQENSGNHNFNYVADSGANTHHGLCQECGKVLSSADHELDYATYVSEAGHKGYCKICKTEVTLAHTPTGNVTDTGFHDFNSHWQTCSLCNGKVNETAHTWESWNWTQGEDTHSKTCPTCEEVYTQSHSYSSWSNEDGSNHKRICTDCQKEVTASHVWGKVWYSDDQGNHYHKCEECDTAGEGSAHTMRKIAEIPATCVDNGIHAYYICTTCGDKFTDLKGLNIIEDLDNWKENGGKIESLGDEHHFVNGVCVNCGDIDPEVKQELENEIQDAIDDVQGKIDELEGKKSDPGLSQEEEDKLKELEEALKRLQQALEDLENADNSQDVGGIIEDAKGAIGGAADAMDDGELKAAKKSAQEKIDEAVTKAEEAIDNKVASGEITAEEGANLKKEVRDEAKKAKDLIDQATSTDDVEKEQKKAIGEDGESGTIGDVVAKADTLHSWNNDEWAYDSTGHWHACKDPECTVKKDFTSHTMSEEIKIEDNKHYIECTTDGCDYKHYLGTHGTTMNHDEGGHWYECTVCGRYNYTAHNWTDGEGSWTQEEDYHSKTCQVCLQEYKQNHVYSSWTDASNGNHSKTCEVCSKEVTQSHNWGDALYDDGNGKHYQKCADCGAASEGVAHNMQRVGEVPATCTDSGSKAYFICTDCAGIYANSNGTNKIPNLNDWLASEGKIPSLGGGSHDYDPDTGICSVCGSLDPEVKEELEQKLKDAQSQLEDKKRELEEKKSQPGGLSPEEEAKLKELEEKLKQLQDALDDLENANSSDNMGDIVDNANGALGDAADETDDTLAQDKLDALDKLEQAYEEQKQEVTNGSLTAEQQKDLLAQLADAYSEAQKKIKQATSKEEADKAAEDGSKVLEELVENYNPDTVPGGSHTHTWTTKFDDKYHWEECTDASCNARKEVTAHDDNGWKVDANGNHYKYCDTCSNEYLKDKHVLVEHKGYAATCTEHGMEDYWQCAICKAYFEDEKGMEEIPDFGVWSNQGGSGYIDIVADAHKWDSAWHYDSDTQGHYHVCEYDGSHHSTDVQSHNFEGAYYDDGNGKHYQKCADCGAAGEGVAHNMQRVGEVPATCTDNGSKAYFICTDCAGIYSNAKGTNKIPNLSDWLESEGKIPSLNNGSHDYDEETGICKVCGSLNPEVKEELQKKLEDAQQQLEEKKRELEEKRDSGGGLSKEEEEKLKELEEKLQQLQDALDELENANGSSNAGDIVDDVNNALGGAADATDDDGSLSDAKLKALDDLEKEYEKQQQAVTGGSLSSEQQTDLLAQLADAYKEAQKKIKQATTKQEAEAAADAGAENLRDLVENYDPDTVPGAGHKHTWTTKYDNENHWDECTSCSARQNVQAHDESNWLFSGYNHYKHCETCGHDYGVAKHTLVEYKETSSTCVTHGHEAYWHCPVCESYFTNASGSAASRIGGQSEFDVWYTGAGQKDLDTENGHRWSKTLTHDASGHWYECLNEGCSEKRDYQDHRDSSFYDGLKWTFIDNDYHGKVCDTCGEVITKTVHGNGVTSWTTNGTETHSGECATCNHKVTKAHDFAAGNYDKNDDGHWTACVDCNQADDDFEEHRVNLWIDDGDTLHHHGTCLDCGKELTRGHSWRWVQEPDSEEFRRTCSACLYADPTTQGHIVDEWIPVDGTQHKGNCLAEGHTNEELFDDHHFFTNYDGTYHWQECEECGYIDEATRAAHVLLTGTSNGTETHRGTCTECGQEITNQNHTWVMKHDDINHWQECTVCGEKRDEIKHTVEWTTDGDSTHTGTCSVCHEEITHDHTWLFGFCTECRDSLGNYAEAESDVGIAAAAIVAQLFALIAVAAIVSRRMKK